MQVRLELDNTRILQKVTNDKFGLFVSHEWKRLIDPFTPRDNGILLSNVQQMPFKIWYKSPYAHYQYMGVKYVDPVYKVGGFFSPEYGWWSRKGVKKVPSGEPLNYQKRNPYATHHWDIAAVNAGQLNKLYQTINNALNSGRY